MCVLPAERLILLLASNSALQFLKSFFSFGFSVFLVLKDGMNTFMYFLFTDCKHTHTHTEIKQQYTHLEHKRERRRE